jgi:pyruvate ferredoxin oxidoreductase beta subunit
MMGNITGKEIPFQIVKFYQTGTFTVGNRLLDEAHRAVQANMERTNSLNSGHRACQGCGEALVACRSEFVTTDAA